MAIVIETHIQTGVEWGVSLTSHDPHPVDYEKVCCQDCAQRLMERLVCPNCFETSRLLTPMPSWPRWTCDPCGTDFGPDIPWHTRPA